MILLGQLVRQHDRLLSEVPLNETGVEFDEDKIDRIELFYEDSPEATIRATVNRLLSDRDEGMGLV